MPRRHFWPDAEQLPLLRFCLAREPGEAEQAWRKWKGQVELDDLDSSCFRLISLAYLRLLELQISEPELNRIRGIYRYQWTKNQLVWRGKAELLQTLQAEGMETMLLKGAALGGTVYPKPAARGMHDLDFCVPIQHAETAIRLLQARGWLAQHFDAVRTIPYFHGCSFLDREGGELDLHWHVMRSYCSTARDAELWQAAVNFSQEDLTARILCPADQLLHACEHGQHRSPASALQWLVDAVMIIRHSPAPFDWARLVEQARKFQMTLTVRRALRYLREHFEPGIPAGVLAELSRPRVSWREQAEYALTHRAPAQDLPFFSQLGLAACHYWKIRKGDTPGEVLADFSVYFRLLRHEKREWPVVFREGLRTARAKWRDDRAEMRFRAGRFLRFGSRVSGGLITRFRPTDLQGFYQLETEFGSPYRWTQTEASVRLFLKPGRCLIRMQMRPFRDLSRLKEDGLSFQLNDRVIPQDRYVQEGPFLTLWADESLLDASGSQTLSLSIGRWPAPGDPRQLGLPISRLWIYHGSPERA
jgi:hypothetical protein